MPFLLAGCKPTVTILAPTNRAIFEVGEETTFEGQVTDLQHHALADDVFVWTSDKDEKIGTGVWFTSADLSEGEHTENNMDLVCGNFKPKWAVPFSRHSLLVKFPNQGVLDLLKENVDMDSLPTEITYSVKGNLKNDGPSFEGTDTGRVINSRWWQRQ